MAKLMTATVDLGSVEKKLSRWRKRHGGRGRPIPQELWAEATDVATVAGVELTARVLGVDRERLVRRVAERSSGGESVVALPARMTPAVSAAFVEVDAQRVFTRGKAVVRLTRRDGEQLEIEVEGGAKEAVVVAGALWERSR